jgi:CheY-like chemotaxis protein
VKTLTDRLHSAGQKLILLARSGRKRASIAFSAAIRKGAAMIRARKSHSDPKTEPKMPLILIAGDDVNGMQLLRQALADRNYRVVEPVTREGAYRLDAETDRPDALICDFNDPQAQGKAFLDVARIRYGKTTMPPVLFLVDQAEDEQLAKIYGADDLIPKPFTDTAVTDWLGRVMKPKAAPRQP